MRSELKSVLKHSAAVRQEQTHDMRNHSMPEARLGHAIPHVTPTTTVPSSVIVQPIVPQVAEIPRVESNAVAPSLAAEQMHSNGAPIPKDSVLTRSEKSFRHELSVEAKAFATWKRNVIAARISKKNARLENNELESKIDAARWDGKL